MAANLHSFLATAICSFVLLLSLPRVARQIGLLDHPDQRKHHETATPLVGGISIAIAVSVGVILLTAGISTHRMFLLSFLVICVVGIVDDLVDLAYRVKMFWQIAVASIIVVAAGEQVTHIGYIFFSDVGYGLGPFSQVFTVIGIVGLMNAYNMIDGHDGLAGGCALIALFSVLLILSVTQSVPIPTLLILFLIATSTFLIFNFDSVVGLKRQVFLGDAGSLMLGLAIAYFMIKYSGHAPGEIKVSAAPWLVGLPLLDMIAVMIRRSLNRRSPFSADRIHFHHVMMDFGLSKGRVLLLALALQLVFSGIGIFGVLRDWPDGTLFWGLFVALLIYLLLMKSLSRSAERSQARSAS